MRKMSFYIAACAVLISTVSVAAITKGPYLIYPGSSSSMTVLWQTDVTQSSTLYWGTSTSYSSGSVSSTEINTAHQHKKTVTGLAAGTRYYYKVTIGSANHTGDFKTAPASSATDVKFLVYGDTRTNPGDHNAVASRIVSTFTADSAYQTFLLHVGDFAQYNTEASWTSDFFPRNQSSILSMQSKIPIQGVMGNHEGSAAMYKKYYPYPFVADRYWSFDYGPVHVSVVDQCVISTSSDTTGFTLSSAQKTWLINDLSSTSKKWKVILLHHPGWSAGGHANNSYVMNTLHPLFKQYGVAAVFGGHNHYYARAVKDGIHYVTTGGGGAPLGSPVISSPIVTGTKALQLCKVKIIGDDLTCSAIKASDASVIDTFTVTKSQSVPNDSSFVSQTVPASMTAGQTVSVNVVMKNTGSDIWTAAAGHSLGITPTNNIWAISGNRVALPGNVAAGANVTFTFNITAPATAGTYTFEMQMVDDIAPNQSWFGGKATKQISVSGANLPPSFATDPFSKPDATVGTAYDEPFNGQASDPEGSSITFSKVSGPEWMSVHSTGRAQGTPGSADVGTNSFIVKVTDAGGLSDTATMLIKVNSATNAVQTVSFTSIGAEDGYLNESTETSNIGGGFNATGTAGAGLRIGDTTTKQQHKSVVSFDTSSLPDGAVIQSATLKLMRGAISGTVTNLGLIKVDIKGSTGFSGATALQNADFEAAADAASVATMSYPSANGTLSTGSLNATGLTKVNKTGRTQLRIYFATDDNNDAVSDYLGFYPAENATAANRPLLEVTYQ